MAERTVIKDLVLVYLEDKPFSFARIEDIREDWKKGWYHVTLLFLQVPLQMATWILRDIYIDGGEFTMDGKRLRLEKVEAPELPSPSPESEPPDDGGKGGNEPSKSETGNVIAFGKRRK
jgi:hypothetical protein